MFKKLINKIVDLWVGLPFEHHSYYSPLPEINEIKKNPEKIYKKLDLSKINFKSLSYIENLMNSLSPYFREYVEIKGEVSDKKIIKLGQGYGEIEGRVLYALIRHVKPKKVIEVGIGISTYFINKSLEKNKTEDGIEYEHTCIDPYVTEDFKKFFKNVNLIEKEVQSISVEFFNKLKKNDLFFIDSSHVSKIGSDVNYLILDILPTLQKGCIIHFHDIPFPYLTNPINHPIFLASCYWNETALLKSFLDYNSDFEVIMSQSIMNLEHKMFGNYFSDFDVNKYFPNSIYLGEENLK